MKTSLRILIAAALLTLTAAQTQIQVQARGNLTETITTSGGFTVSYSDNFEAEEADDLSISLVDPETELNVDLYYGDNVLPGLDLHGAEEVMDTAVELLGDRGLDFDLDAREYVELENGEAIVQPYELNDVTALLVVVDMNDGEVMLVLIGGNITPDDEQIELGLEIAGTAYYDAEAEDYGFDGSKIVPR